MIRKALLACMLLLPVATAISSSRAHKAQMHHSSTSDKEEKDTVQLSAEDSKETALVGSDGAIHRSSQGPPHTEKTLQEIFKKANTDKMWRHGYHRYYEKQLAPYRNIDGARILEIGADTGKSLASWLEYFNKPALVGGVAYGVDAEKARQNACAMMPSQCSKLDITSMDQSDTDALANLVQKNPQGWDVVIDDGSHVPQHQLVSFQRLWPNVRPGGLYALEDIETSYVDTGNVYGHQLHAGIGREPPFNAVEQFKRLVDVVNRKHFGHPELTAFNGVDNDVASVIFADGLIFVEKKPADPEWDKYPADVVFGSKNDAESMKEYSPKLEGMNKWFADPHPH